MRYLKTYRVFESAGPGLTKEQEEFLNKYTKGSWTYDPKTGLVDVEGDFNCIEQGLSDFKGVRFGKVSGNFKCENNKLTSLEGAPQKVGGGFSCYNNRLTTLNGAPQKVGGNFSCRWNQLTTLKGAPQEVGGNFSCRNNQLTTLEGAPQKVGGDFDCWHNQLTSLEGAPQKIRGDFVCYNNSLTSLEGAPQEVGGYFYCDAFTLESGEWNLEGWLEVLKKGKMEAQQLILPLLPPEVLNQEIRKDPTGMIMKLKEVWNDESFRETRSKLVWPRGYEEEADLVGDLDDVGF
jgi:hypothetical protein